MANWEQKASIFLASRLLFFLCQRQKHERTCRILILCQASMKTGVFSSLYYLRLQRISEALSPLFLCPWCSMRQWKKYLEMSQEFFRCLTLAPISREGDSWKQGKSVQTVIILVEKGYHFLPTVHGLRTKSLYSWKKSSSSSCNEKFTFLIHRWSWAHWSCLVNSSENMGKTVLPKPMQNFSFLTCLTYVKYPYPSLMKNLTAFSNFAKVCLRF